MRTAKLIDAIETLISTRDMCGNERQALREWQQENGTLTPRETRTILLAVEGEWRHRQVAQNDTQ